MNQFRKLRLEAGVTQEAVAVRMGVRRERVAAIERARKVRPETERRFREAVCGAAAEKKRVTETLLKATGELDIGNPKMSER